MCIITCVDICMAFGLALSLDVFCFWEVFFLLFIGVFPLGLSLFIFLVFLARCFWLRGSSVSLKGELIQFCAFSSPGSTYSLWFLILDFHSVKELSWCHLFCFFKWHQVLALQLVSFPWYSIGPFWLIPGFYLNSSWCWLSLSWTPTFLFCSWIEKGDIVLRIVYTQF